MRQPFSVNTCFDASRSAAALGAAAAGLQQVPREIGAARRRAPAHEVHEVRLVGERALQLFFSMLRSTPRRKRVLADRLCLCTAVERQRLVEVGDRTRGARKAQARGRSPRWRSSAGSSRTRDLLERIARSITVLQISGLPCNQLLERSTPGTARPSFLAAHHAVRRRPPTRRCRTSARRARAGAPTAARAWRARTSRPASRNAISGDLVATMPRLRAAPGPAAPAAAAPGAPAAARRPAVLSSKRRRRRRPSRGGSDCCCSDASACARYAAALCAGTTPRCRRSRHPAAPARACGSRAPPAQLGQHPDPISRMKRKSDQCTMRQAHDGVPVPVNTAHRV